MNRESQKRQILKFINNKILKDIDAFCIYQWIERCHFEGWWDLALSLRVPPNSLNQDYHKRLNYLLSDCGHNAKIAQAQERTIVKEKATARRRAIAKGPNRNRWGRLINARTGVMDALLEEGATIEELHQALCDHEPDTDPGKLLSYVKGHLRYVVEKNEIPGWIREGKKYRFPRE